MPPDKRRVMNASNSILDAISRTLDVQGRTSRPAFWWVFLCYICATIILVFLDFLLFEELVDVPVEAYFPLTDTFYLVSLVSITTLTMRRWHDAGFPSWPVVVVVAVDVIATVLSYGKPEVAFIDDPLLVIATMTGLASLAVCLLPSQKRDSKYGPNPNEVPQ
ncbi:DUF805 domain-containing protein [Synechococcus sp. MU1644]|nr:DUF805 domain-containing protein [Synechococcus sp. MU1644]